RPRSAAAGSVAYAHGSPGSSADAWITTRSAPVASTTMSASCGSSGWTTASGASVAQPSALIAPAITSPEVFAATPASASAGSAGGPGAGPGGGRGGAGGGGGGGGKRPRPPSPFRSASCAGARALAAFCAPLLGAPRSRHSLYRSLGSSAPRGHGFLAAFA